VKVGVGRLPGTGTGDAAVAAHISAMDTAATDLPRELATRHAAQLLGTAISYRATADSIGSDSTQKAYFTGLAQTSLYAVATFLAPDVGDNATEIITDALHQCLLQHPANNPDTRTEMLESVQHLRRLGGVTHTAAQVQLDRNLRAAVYLTLLSAPTVPLSEKSAAQWLTLGRRNGVLFAATRWACPESQLTGNLPGDLCSALDIGVTDLRTLRSVAHGGHRRDDSR